MLYLSRAFVEFGPFPAEELVSFYQRGLLKDSDYVRQEGSSDWTHVNDWAAVATAPAVAPTPTKKAAVKKAKATPPPAATPAPTAKKAAVKKAKKAS